MRIFHIIVCDFNPNYVIILLHANAVLHYKQVFSHVNKYTLNDRIHLLTCGDKIIAIRKHRKQSIHICEYIVLSSMQLQSA